jgi:ribosomal protein L11 methyltransferase
MGFGTGHHPTTRFCLEALQTLDLRRKTVLDVGTGSGILAIAARALGAQSALGIDNDPDAIQSARENLELNENIDGVRFELADVTALKVPTCDVVTANLTGTMLQRNAPMLLRAVERDGVLLLSGILGEERDLVFDAFGAHTRIWERGDGEWVAAMLSRPPR